MEGWSLVCPTDLPALGHLVLLLWKVEGDGVSVAGSIRTTEGFCGRGWVEWGCLLFGKSLRGAVGGLSCFWAKFHSTEVKLHFLKAVGETGP